MAGPMGLLIALKDRDLSVLKIFGVVAAVIYIPSLVWSLVAGAAYMLFVVRRRGRISSPECLLIGAIVAFALPSVLLAIIGLNESLSGRTGGFGSGWISSQILSALGGGLLLIPSGIFGGWVFWWITSLRNNGSAAPEMEVLSQSSNSAK
nr:hypothetical protein [uncultured Dongia sp.]